METKRKSLMLLSIYYFFIFYALGGFFPLLSVYLKNTLHLSGAEVGTITSIPPIIALFVQPLWGMLCDYTQRPKTVLFIAALGMGVIAIPYMFASKFAFLILFAALMAVFQSAVVPISDSLTANFALKVEYDYGNIRLWGAIGFAFAAFIMGKLGDHFTPEVIFLGVAGAMVIGALLSRGIPNTDTYVSVNLRKGLRSLFSQPKFVLFILSAFLIFGPIQANNIYFGLLIDHAGGSLTAVGFAFLLAAGLEAPFMMLAGPWIRKRGYLLVILIASLVSAMRWIYYIWQPDLTWLYITTIVQGFSVGLFIPAALNYVKVITPAAMTVTAVSLYAAFGNGLGNWFSTFVGGFLLDAFSLSAVYIFFTLMTAAGMVILLMIPRLGKKKIKKPEA